MSSPLADALEREVSAKLRERGLVVWLDREGVYSDFVDSLPQAPSFKFPVIAHRGSFLQTLLALEDRQEGLDPEGLLLHVPGHTDTTIRSTPLLETYRAGTRYERALETLVQEVAAGQASPEQTRELLAEPGLTFDRVQRWLESLARPEDSFAAYLSNLRPEWVLEGLLGLHSDLKIHANREPASVDTLRDYWNRHTGFSREFEQFFLNGQNAGDWWVLGEAFLAWLLCVEYVHDLSRPVSHPNLTPLQSLSPPLRKTSVKLTQRWRKQNASLYCYHAMNLEAVLGAELDAGSPEDLGKIDTFSKEDARLLGAAVDKLKQEQWGQAHRWATERLDSPSVWVKSELTRRHEWMLIQSAARLGKELASHPSPLQTCDDLAEALQRYTGAFGSTNHGAEAVDRAHRKFEQQRLRLLNAQLPNFAILHDALSLLRRRYREWVDQLCADFSYLCEANGFLPESDQQQRHLYEQEVHPLTQRAGKVAYFLVDALRYEMASELASGLEDQGGQLQLKARLTELPSITSVGMNSLAPVCRDGKLTMDKPFKGFRAGEYTVHDMPTRLRAMGERSLERYPKERKAPLSYALQDLVNIAPAQLKKKAKETSLIVVHSREIDEAGEADVGLLGLEQWLGMLRSAILHLRGAGVDEFVITADHGFMLLDETSPPVPYGAGVNRRFVLSDALVHDDRMTTVSLESLGYQGQTGWLMLLRTSGVFATKGVSAVSFAHGGNSLQERVIPVLRLSYRQPGALNLVKYRLETQTLPRVMGCSRMRVTLRKAETDQGVLDFASGEKITIALRVVDELGQVDIKDAPDTELNNQQLLLEVGKPVEIYFTITSTADGKVAVELYHPDALKDVTPCRPPEFFQIDETRIAESSVPLQISVSWEQNLPEEVRQVFQHIDHFDSITEDEVVTKLGSARKARRFGADLEKYVPLLPFKVMVENAASGKRWVKA